MTGKISDLTSADRLRSADVFELQDQTIVGSPQMDALTLGAGIPLDTTAQLLGYSGDTMEVEANTLAARLNLKPDEINYPPAGWLVSRQAWAGSNFVYPTIGSLIATPGNIIFEFAWVNVAGIAIIRKVLVNLAIGASTNTVSGTAFMRIYRTFGLGSGILDASNVNFPPPQGGNSVTGRSPATVGSTGLKSNQPPGQARINAGISRTTRGGTQGENAYTDAQPLGNIEGGFVAGAGKTIFRQGVLFDHMVAEEPLILVPGTGFEVWYSVPTTSSGSSSTVVPFVNLQWDEWTLSAPGGTNG